MSKDTRVTYPRCGCGGNLYFATGLPVCVTFDGGDIRVEVDLGELDDIDQDLNCETCDEPTVTDEEWNRMRTLLIYAGKRMDLRDTLRMPTDGDIERRTAFDGEPIEVVGG